MGSLTPEDVQKLVNKWAGQRAPRTVRRDYGVLRAILNFARVHDMVGRTPCRKIRLPEVRREARHIVDADELARLAQELGGVGKLGPMVYLGAIGGLRWGEVAGLRVRHLDVTARTVSVADTGRTRYEGLGFHDLRRANATGLVAAGVDVTTSQGLLGHSDSRLTLDHDAQVVTELGARAAEAMGERFMRTPARDNPAMEGGSGPEGARPRTRREGL